MANPPIKTTFLPKFRPTLNITKGLASAAEMNNALKNSTNQFDTFILQLNTVNSGVSAPNQFTLPLRAGETYNFIATVDGVDLSPHTTDSSPTYTFNSAGINLLEIRGADPLNLDLGFPGLHFDDGGDKLKVINLVSWGFTNWTSSEDAFYGCENMVISTEDIVPVGSTTNFSRAFWEVNTFVVDSRWDLSNATTLDGFANDSGLTAFNPSGNLDSVTDMARAFAESQVTSIRPIPLPACTTINSMCTKASLLVSIEGVFTDLSLVQDATHAFSNMNIAIAPALSLPVCTDTNSMFRGCVNLLMVEEIQFGMLEDGRSMFEDSTSLTTFVGIMDFSTATNLEAMLEGCSAVNNLPLWDLSSNLDMDRFVKECLSLTGVPNWTLTACTSMFETFRNDAELLNVPDFNGSTGNVTIMASCLAGCGELTDLPDWDVSNCTNFGFMFIDCTMMVYNGTTVYELKPAASINCSSMFRACNALELPVLLTNSGSITNHNSMYSFTCITVFPPYDYTNTTNLNGYCQQATVEIVTACNAPLCTGMFDFVSNCPVTSVTGIVTTNVLKTTGFMFAGCNLLIEVGVFDTSGVNNAQSMFANNSALTELPIFDWSSNIIFNNYLSGTTLTPESYGDQLTSVDANGLSDGTFDGGNSQYIAPSTPRNSMINKNWVVTDGGAFMAYAMSKFNPSYGVEVPDHPTLDMTNDFSGYAWVFPHNRNSAQFVMGKYESTGNQRSWILGVDTSGFLRFWHSTDGAAATIFVSTIEAPLGTISLVHFRLTGGSVYLGKNGSSEQSTAKGACFSGTAPIEIGKIDETSYDDDFHISQAVLSDSPSSLVNMATIYGIGRPRPYADIDPDITENDVMAFELSSNDTSLTDESGTSNDGAFVGGSFVNGEEVTWDLSGNSTLQVTNSDGDPITNSDSDPIRVVI